MIKCGNFYLTSWVTTILKLVKQNTRVKEFKMATEHKHGSMDTEVQEKTFAGFINWTTKTVIVCILALIFIALVNG
tara:strand:- start:222 stop:449 length:228 start_codon:yes stop_codon:yes gene_type:complete